MVFLSSIKKDQHPDFGSILLFKCDSRSVCSLHLKGKSFYESRFLKKWSSLKNQTRKNIIITLGGEVIGTFWLFALKSIFK